MTAHEPRAYQPETIDKLSTAFVKLLNTTDTSDRLIVFKSPTGSGKTLMVGYALAKTIANPSVKPFIVLWLSPGKGDLHKQSARSLSRMLASSLLEVRLLDSREDIAANSIPESGTVFVVNWEKLRTEKEGEWANKMLREGETANLFTMLENTTKRGYDMIVVVDESHTNLDGPQTAKLMNAIGQFRPFIQIEASATPSSRIDEEKREEGLHHSVVVPFSKVELAGMVRRSVLLNPDFELVQTKHSSDSLDVQVLWAAWERTEELAKRYESEGSSVKPLLLIQYPDGKKAEARAAVVEEFLNKRGLRKDETYATWLSGDHSDNLEHISNFNSPYRALIFKQAIATGWDCPRAQVLVQFRIPGSETFQIQTLGRILRSPELKHYDDETLNVAYVYSDLAGVSVKILTDEPEYALKDLVIKRGNRYPATGIKLHSVFQPRRREYHYPTSDSLDPELVKALDSTLKTSLTAEPLKSTLTSVLTEGEVELKALIAHQSIDFKGKLIDASLGEEVTQAMFDLVLTARVAEYRSKEQCRSRIKTSLVRWFQSQRPKWQLNEIQHFVLAHRSKVSEAIDTACRAAMKLDEAKAIADARSKRRTSDSWEIPVNDLVSSSNWIAPSAAGNVFDPPRVPMDRSKPEQRFESWIADQVAEGNAKWWWKNGARDEKYLGVEYRQTDTASQTNHEEICYPDYLVMAKDDTVWAVEVKDVNDPDGTIDGKSAAKAKGLSNWAKKLNSERQKSKELLDLPKVAACVAVPVDDGNGGVIVKACSPTKWTEPTIDNIGKENGWKDLKLEQ